MNNPKFAIYGKNKYLSSMLVERQYYVSTYDLYIYVTISHELSPHGKVLCFAEHLKNGIYVVSKSSYFIGLEIPFVVDGSPTG
ncbi:hypothetical protein Hanom_Chr00s029153g01768871 [Helianthus anomalus]